MPDVLIFGDTTRSPEMRHEVPLTIPDGFLYIEQNGKRHVVISSLEVPRVRELPNMGVLSWDELGWEELLAQGVHREKLYLHLAERGCGVLGVKQATVPPGFPVELADHLRASGVELTVDRQQFSLRRRVKNEEEIEGIRRAQRACEAAMDAIRDLLRRSDASGEELVLDGEPLTVERVKQRVNEVFNEHDAVADEFIVSHGPQSAVGHELGSGPIAPREPIIVDLWPRDRETGCHSDMTRTFCVGEPPEDLVEFHRLCKRALHEAIAACKAGAEGNLVFRGTCELFMEHGYKTQLNKDLGETLEEGFIHGLGHGVGLEVHEEPNLGLSTGNPMVAGDVITIEPGLYRPSFGGCRLEDILVVTESGVENLTDYPYDLAP